MHVIVILFVRLMTLLVKGLLYDECETYCADRARGTKHYEVSTENSDVMGKNM